MQPRIVDDHFCRQHAEKLDELHSDVKSIAAYVPKIEIALERLTDMRAVVASYSEVNKDQYRLHREAHEHISGLKLNVTGLESRIGVLEESRKGILSIIGPVWTAVIIGILLVIVVFMVSHGVIPAQVTTNGK